MLESLPHRSRRAKLMAEFCAKLGGELRRNRTPWWNRDRHPGISICPFDAYVAVNYQDKKIFYAEDTPHWATLIHEAGHVFADPSSPTYANETRWLGWEYAVARKFDVVSEWLRGQENYYLDLDEIPRLKTKDLDPERGYSTIGDFLRTKKDRELLHRVLLPFYLAESKSYGSVSRRGVPLSVRK